MLYTIFGVWFGIFIARIIGKQFSVDFRDGQYALSSGSLLMLCGGLIGGGIGMGYGTALLIGGTHIYNKIWDFIKLQFFYA